MRHSPAHRGNGERVGPDFRRRRRRRTPAAAASACRDKQEANHSEGQRADDAGGQPASASRQSKNQERAKERNSEQDRGGGFQRCL